MSEMVTTIAKILYDKKAQNIVALNVKDLTVITDCMLIATGRSTIQVRTLADEVEERMTEMGMEPVRKEGYQVKNGDFMRIGVPFTLAAIIPAYIYIWIFYGI